MLYTLCFSLFKMQFFFIMLTCLVPVLFTFYTQGVLKLKNNNSGAKGLKTLVKICHYEIYNNFSIFPRTCDSISKGQEPHRVLCRVNVSVYWKQETQVVISVTHNTTWASNDFLPQNVAQKSLDTVDQMLINWQVICATG